LKDHYLERSFFNGKSLNSIKRGFPFKLVNQNPIVFYPTRLLANIICVIGKSVLNLQVHVFLMSDTPSLLTMFPGSHSMMWYLKLKNIIENMKLHLEVKSLVPSTLNKRGFTNFISLIKKYR